MTQYYQNHTGIPTYSNARDAQRMESGNHIYRTGI